MLLKYDRVLEEMCHISYMDIREAFDENGKLKQIKDLPDRVAKSIAGIEFEDIWEGTGADRRRIGRTVKIKMIDKMAAANSIARHLGMFVDRTETSLTVTASLPAAIRERRRVRLEAINAPPG